MDLNKVITTLDLKPHPEGGFFRETYRCSETFSTSLGKSRSAGTAIYFLIPKQVHTQWHQVTSDEMWHYYEGAPVELEVETHEGDQYTVTLGSVSEGFEPQILIPAHAWQRAKSIGEWSLCGCTVNPGFDFEDFTLR